MFYQTISVETGSYALSSSVISLTTSAGLLIQILYHLLLLVLQLLLKCQKLQKIIFQDTIAYLVSE
jgi:Ran GTPase-activating protein (RanGAP) involved in mRNA processing and transport